MNISVDYDLCVIFMDADLKNELFSVQLVFLATVQLITSLVDEGSRTWRNLICFLLKVSFHTACVLIAGIIVIFTIDSGSLLMK